MTDINQEKKDAVFKVLKYRGLGYTLLFSIILFIAAIFFIPAIAFGVFSMLIFIDMIGYHFILYRGKLEIYNEFDGPPVHNIMAYRILDTILDIEFLLAMGVIVWLAAGLLPAIASILICLILFFTGCKDIMFYYLYHLPLAKDWTWTNWTVVAWFQKASPTGTQMQYQTTIGFIVTIAIVILWVILL